VKVIERINGSVRLDTEGLSRAVVAQIIAAAMIISSRKRKGLETDLNKLREVVKARYRQVKKNEDNNLARHPHRNRKLMDVQELGIRITEDYDCKTGIVVSSRFGKVMLTDEALQIAQKIIENQQESGKPYVRPRNTDHLMPQKPVTLNQLMARPKPISGQASLNQTQGAS
jgi:hypothetical protein